MKKIAILLTLVTSMICSAQTPQSNQVNYITGSPMVTQYGIKTCSVDISSLNISSVTPAPILQVYVASKNDFIGGVLVNEKGKKTKIKDLTLEKSPTGRSLFTVVGKDFSSGFTLADGFILAEEKNEIVFYTDKVGIWKVIKK